MASNNRGREITVAFETDTSDFDADRVANELEDVSDSARDAERSMERLARSADDAGRESSAAFDEAKESGRGAASEIAGSFDGSMEGVVGAVQGAVGELGASLGGLGGAALVGGALAIGVAMAGYAEETERAKENTDRLYESIKESFQNGGEIDPIEFASGLESKALNRLADDADKLGLSLETVTKAHAGNADAVQAVDKATRDYYKNQEDGR